MPFHLKHTWGRKAILSVHIVAVARTGQTAGAPRAIYLADRTNWEIIAVKPFYACGGAGAPNDRAIGLQDYPTHANLSGDGRTDGRALRIQLETGRRHGMRMKRACVAFCNIRLDGSPAAATTASSRLRQKREEWNAACLKVAC